MGGLLLPHWRLHTCQVPSRSGEGHGGRSFLEAAPKLPPKLGLVQKSAVADHYKQDRTTLERSSSIVAKLNTLDVEPTFLARVHKATWQSPDAEMRKIVRRAPGTHAQFHVGSRHELEQVFRGQGEAARLVVPRVYQ